MQQRIVALIVACVIALVSQVSFAAGQEKPPELRWWKGNLHTHTLWSDGDDFPDMVASWYRDRGYQFLGISDHNTLQQGERWVNIVKMRGGQIAFDKYLARFGPEWVETRGESAKGGPIEVRLKPIEEYRTLVESPGEFLIVQSEEISDKVDGAPVHLNAHNLVEVIKPAGGATVAEAIDANVRQLQEQAQRTRREMFIHLNHPNFRWAVTAEDLAAVVGEKFFEVYNGHPSVHTLGDAQHAGVERIWDIANTIRIAKLQAAPLYGLGTDDSHHYHVEGMARSTPGRGWIMVRSRYLTPEYLVRAIKAGDFYASSGVTLNDVLYKPESKTLTLSIAAEEGVTYTTQFIGTREGVDLTATPRTATDEDGRERTVTGKYSDDVGESFATVEGVNPSYELKGDELYVRAVVTSSKAPAVPSYENQKAQAWTQPVGWEERVPSTTAPAQ